MSATLAVAGTSRACRASAQEIEAGGPKRSPLQNFEPAAVTPIGYVRSIP
jgi:hypothetical protein